MRIHLTPAIACTLVVSSAALAHDDKPHADDTQPDHGAHVAKLVSPPGDSVNGMKLFVELSCVGCHAVNGVGGHDAEPLNAHDMMPVMNPLDFAAKMWAKAPAMIKAQKEAYGKQITFTGAQLGDIIAFLHDDPQQHLFSEGTLSPEALALMDHDHGGATGTEHHKDEIGHGDTVAHVDDGHSHE